MKAKKLNIKITKKDVSRFIFDCLVILLGTCIMSLSFSIFFKPNNIVPGGFIGLSQIIYDLLAKINFTYISISVWYLILNSFLYIYALKLLGWKFGLRAGIGIASYSLFIEIWEKTNFIQTILNKISQESSTLGESSFILFAIFGGIISGVGIGIVFRGNGSTGGCDMLALVCKKLFPNMTTGQWVIIVDATVVTLSLIAYQSLILPLYALIAIYLMGKVSDVITDGIRALKAYYILTDKKDELTQQIMLRLHHSVTSITCEGAYSKAKKDMLLVMVTNLEVAELKNIVKDIDPKSFMFCSNVKEAYGSSFMNINDIKPNKLQKFLTNKKSHTKTLNEKKSESNTDYNKENS